VVPVKGRWVCAHQCPVVSRVKSVPTSTTTPVEGSARRAPPRPIVPHLVPCFVFLTRVSCSSVFSVCSVYVCK